MARIESLLSTAATTTGPSLLGTRSSYSSRGNMLVYRLSKVRKDLLSIRERSSLYKERVRLAKRGRGVTDITYRNRHTVRG